MFSRRKASYVAVMLALASPLAMGQAGGLPEETSARQAADAALQSTINAEAAARAAADIRLQNSINDESASRALSEARLQNEIDQLRNSGAGNAGATVTVDCAAGQTVSQALAAGANRVIVRGICRESVTVAREDVTLQADLSGGGIEGPDARVNTLEVTANRVTIDGLTITGGRNGITGLGAANLAVRNCTVQSVGRTGIVYGNGSSGTIDGCKIQFSARDGVAVDGSQATIVNSLITNNDRNGVAVVNRATSRIGTTDRFEPAGNTISQNGGNGIGVNIGAVATIAMNTITGNGMNPASPGRSGIGVFQSATADIVGGNTISGHPAVGVAVNLGSTAFIGDANLGLPSLNTISENAGGGVTVFMASSLVIRDAVIERNTGHGLLFSVRSQGQMFSTTIRGTVDPGNNTGDGIRVLLGSALFPLAPNSTVSGNAGFGVQCFDAESSIINIPFNVAVTGNSRGEVAPGCTAF